MFALDIVHLRQYYASRLGERSHALIATAIGELWPQAKDETVLGVGYAMPYLAPYLVQAATLAVCMPAEQGAVSWPPHVANRVFMAHTAELPLSENSVNRALVIHALEHSEPLSGLMQELWRVLAPGGRVLAIVPNRMGFWSRASLSPFGHGRPFSMTQLRDLFSEHHFTITRTRSALFTPPARWSFVWRAAKWLEILGQAIFPFIGGVLIIEAEKQIYAAIKEPVAVKKRYRASVTAAQPAMNRERR